MRTPITWLVGILVATTAVVTALSWSRGQEQPALPRPAATSPTPRAAAAVPNRPSRDLTRLSNLQRQFYLSAQRGADWLQRANRPDGRFLYGYVPALRTPLEGDHYLRQAGAAFAVARAARFFGDDRGAAVARQAILTLLLDTTCDAKTPQVRSTTLPSTMVNRLAAAGLLVVALNELPDPGDDLLAQSDQLCNYIRSQQRANGSLCLGDDPADPRTEDPEGINYYPGEALYGLLRSQQHRPAAWKTDVARKALAYYQSWWREHKNPAFVPWQTAAWTEAYLLTKERAFADFVNEMNDWVCTLQYQQLDPRRPFWVGGFMGWADGKVQELPPQVSSASYAEGLAEACRVARQTGDVPRYRRYREAIERCLQFLTTLQYTEANAQHFADWYRPALLGAFHASHQDGDLRIDYTQHAVAALVAYLDHVAEPASR
jgi:hypothetical protein